MEPSVYGEITNDKRIELALPSSPSLIVMSAAETSGSSSPVYAIAVPSTTSFPELRPVGVETDEFGVRR